VKAGACAGAASIRRASRVGQFREAVEDLILFATSDGEMRAGRRSEQTSQAAKRLRDAYRDALNEAATAARE
jgi:hypothetical protein